MMGVAKLHVGTLTGGLLLLGSKCCDITVAVGRKEAAMQLRPLSNVGCNVLL